MRDAPIVSFQRKEESQRSRSAVAAEPRFLAALGMTCVVHAALALQATRWTS